VAASTLPENPPSRQEMHLRWYGQVGWYAAQGDQPAVCVYTHVPGETIITGWRDAFTFVADNLPGWTLAGTNHHPDCGHAAAIFVDAKQVKAKGIPWLLWWLSPSCPVCGPRKAHPVPLFHQGDLEPTLGYERDSLGRRRRRHGRG
jgi:hypothetical protein